MARFAAPGAKVTLYALHDLHDPDFTWDTPLTFWKKAGTSWQPPGCHHTPSGRIRLADFIEVPLPSDQIRATDLRCWEHAKSTLKYMLTGDDLHLGGPIVAAADGELFPQLGLVAADETVDPYSFQASSADDAASDREYSLQIEDEPVQAGSFHLSSESDQEDPQEDQEMAE